MTPGIPITAANWREVQIGDTLAFARNAGGSQRHYMRGDEVTVTGIDAAGPEFSAPGIEWDTWLWNGGRRDEEPLFTFVRATK